MSTVTNIRDKWAAKLAAAAADLCAEELVHEHGIAIAVVLIGTDGHWNYAYRSHEEQTRKEAADALRDISQLIEGNVADEWGSGESD